MHTPAKLSHLIRTLRATLSGDTEPVNPAMRATLPNRDYSECCMRMCRTPRSLQVITNEIVKIRTEEAAAK